MESLTCGVWEATCKDDTIAQDGTPSIRLYASMVPGASPNTLYIIGGATFKANDAVQDRVLKVDLTTKSITPVRLTGSIPKILAQHTSTLAKDLVVIIGNCFGGKLVHTINLKTGATTSFSPSLNAPRSLHCHTAVARTRADGGTVVMVFGGARGQESSNKLYQYHVEEAHWELLETRNSPPHRVYHSACMVRNRYMYVFGGAPDAKTTTKEDVVFDDLWRFDCETMEWRLMPSHGNAPGPRGSASLHVVEPFLYLFGGFNGDRELDEFYRYDLDTGVWQAIATCPMAIGGRWAYSSCVVDGKIMYFGGFEKALPPEDAEGVFERQISDSSTFVSESLPSASRQLLSFAPAKLRLKEHAARFIAVNNF